MPISDKLLKNLLFSTLDEFFRLETQEILEGVNERNNCGRMAIYMQIRANQAGLENYFVDVEYNRKQNGEIKTIIDEKHESIPINCDLILHSRGNIVYQDNLIALELKKHDRPQKEKAKDRERLRALTRKSYDGIWMFDGKTPPKHVCGYVLGAYLEINRSSRTYLIELYAHGNCDEEKTLTF